jgi:hypothetical protein
MSFRRGTRRNLLHLALPPCILQKISGSNIQINTDGITNYQFNTIYNGQEALDKIKQQLETGYPPIVRSEGLNPLDILQLSEEAGYKLVCHLKSTL